ncbi:MAG: hypothetical protein Q4G03_06265 [Planctomycetia bacterium]|nr:hypothetical protein [Planctomycetia bacterium]
MSLLCSKFLRYRLSVLSLQLVALPLFALVYFTLCCDDYGVVIAQESTDTQSVELFGDPQFQRGFFIYDNCRKPVNRGVLRLSYLDQEVDAQEKPLWALAQHGSKYDLCQDGDVTAQKDSAVVSTPSQTVARRLDQVGDTVLELSADTAEDYASPRRDGQMWTHLLLVRNFSGKELIRLCEYEHVVFECDARVGEVERKMTAEQFDPNLHAAQASVYFAIPNGSRDSQGYGDFLWFGVSFFDDRYEVQTAYDAVDGDPKTIGTGKLIHRLGGQETIDNLLGGVNPCSHKWVHIRVDLCDYLESMLSVAHERNFMTKTNLDDLVLSHFNFGWEIPGTYRATLELKNLRLFATKKK